MLHAAAYGVSQPVRRISMPTELASGIFRTFQMTGDCQSRRIRSCSVMAKVMLRCAGLAAMRSL